MKNTLITIIIPHYNSPDTLCRLLSSIRYHDDVETIIVDDRSTKYLNEYNNCRQMFEGDSFVFLKNDTTSKGAGTSRNIGLQHASGKWLLFADADDFFLPDWYEKVCKYVETDYDVVYFMPFGEDTTRHLPFVNLIDDYNNQKYCSEQRLRLQFYPPWSKLIQKSVVDTNQICFDETRYSNDVMFSAKVGFYAIKIATSEECIYCLSEKEGSLTKQITFESISIRNSVSCDVYSFLKDRIPKQVMNNLYLANVPLSTIKTVIKSKYGYKALEELLCQYKTVNFPLINLSLDNMCRMAKKYAKKRGS